MTRSVNSSYPAMLVVISTFFPTFSHQAPHIDPWSGSWQIEVFGAGCSLKRDYSNKLAQDAGMYLEKKPPVFDRFSVSFYVPNKTRTYAGKTFIENQLYLSVNSELYPKLSEAQQRIDSVHINGYRLYNHDFRPTANFRRHLADSDAANSILQHLEQAESVSISLVLSDGADVTIKMPSSKRFHVWSKLLSVCTQENISPDPVAETPRSSSMLRYDTSIDTSAKQSRKPE